MPADLALNDVMLIPRLLAPPESDHRRPVHPIGSFEKRPAEIVHGLVDPGIRQVIMRLHQVGDYAAFEFDNSGSAAREA